MSNTSQHPKGQPSAAPALSSSAAGPSAGSSSKAPASKGDNTSSTARRRPAFPINVPAQAPSPQQNSQHLPRHPTGSGAVPYYGSPTGSYSQHLPPFYMMDPRGYPQPPPSHHEGAATPTWSAHSRPSPPHFLTHPPPPATTSHAPPLPVHSEHHDGSLETLEGFGPAPLLRNQACLSCRRRKMRCDAVRPVCGTCARSREKSRQQKHPAPVPPGDCVYEELTRAPRKTSKRRKLKADEDGGAGRTGSEDRDSQGAGGSATNDGYVANLEARVQELEAMLAQQKPPHGNSSLTSAAHSDAMGNPAGPVHQSRKPRAPYETRSIPELAPGDVDWASAAAISGVPQVFSPSPLSTTNGNLPSNVAEPDPFLELLWPGWPADLPSPDTVLHLSEMFFAKSPLRSLIYKPAFMAGLSLPPTHKERPHVALIHSILAVAAPLSPYFEGTRPSIRRAQGQARPFNDQVGDAALPSNAGLRPRQYLFDPRALSFADFHLSRSQEKLDKALLREARNPVDWLQAHVINCHILWSNIRFVEVFVHAAKLTRLITPTGMTRLTTRNNPRRLRVPSVVPPPTSAPEEHERRMVLWWTYITDIFNGGAGLVWETVLDDAGVTANLPPRLADVQAGLDVPPNEQTLASPDLFRTGHLDEFTLLIKAVALQKRAQLLISRSFIGRDPFERPPGFEAIDVGLMEFISSFPPETVDASPNGSFSNYHAPPNGGLQSGVNVLRLLAWCTVHMSVVHLHEHFITQPDLTSESYARTTMAVRATVATVQELCASSFDFGLLHSQIFLCWTVCARMICKEIERQRAGGGDAHSDTVEALDAIISALHRAAEFIPCAARCYTVLMRFRTGKWNEEMLSGYMYFDGLIPLDDGEPEIPVTFSPPRTFESFTVGNMDTNLSSDDGRSHGPRKSSEHKGLHGTTMRDDIDIHAAIMTRMGGTLAEPSETWHPPHPPTQVQSEQLFTDPESQQ